MKVEIKVPAVGESVTEATIGEWTKKDGEYVKRDDIVLVLETDKASVEVVAPNDGVLHVQTKAGETVAIGAPIAFIDTEGQPQTTGNASTQAAPQASTPAPSKPASAPMSAGASGGGGGGAHPELQSHLSPAVRRVVDERGLDAGTLVPGSGRGGRLTKEDVERAPAPSTQPAAKAPKTELPPLPTARGQVDAEVKRVPMTTIRRRIAERLVEAQHTAAILTTFNEVDMSAVMALREKYKDKFKERYGVGLGFMGFFVKAVIEAAKEVPEVNASIEGNDVLYKNFYNIGMAVGTEKGLIVPVIRNADQLSIAEIEMAIKHYAIKAREGKISVDDLANGTFTISNGGVYGSLMSTPILNPPQSGILGMHKIEDRPVVVGKQIEIRPMMYLALSYDHRLIDGKGAVTFLVKVKEGIEDPSRLLLEI